MRMEELNSGDHVGAGTNGTGGVLVSLWTKYGGQGRILLTPRETEWLIEQLQESIKAARVEINQEISRKLTSRQPGVS